MVSNNPRSKSWQEWKCTHSHSKYSHPSCWFKYLEATEPERVGYLDIETNQLESAFGCILSWCIKTKGRNEILFDVLDKVDVERKTYDKALVQSLVDALKGYSIIYTYYGSRFDIPFIRTRALIHGIDFPMYRQVMHRDLYFDVRSKLKLNSNRLAYAAQALGIKGKTPINQKYWMHALSGDHTALNYILEHNKGDVLVLERLHKKLAPFLAPTLSSV